MKLIKNVSMASGKTFKTVNILFDESIELVSTGIITADNITDEYDYSGCIVIPGAVDMHTHIFRGIPDDAQALKKSSQNAVSGGYTTLADMPYHTKKPIFRSKAIDYYTSIIEESSFCDIALWGHNDFSQFPYHIDYINEIWAAGLVGFIMMHPSPNDKIENMTYADIMDLFDTIYDTDISFAFQGYDYIDVSVNENIKEKFIEQRLVSIRKILRRMQDNPIHYIGIYDKESIDILNIAFRRSDLTYAVPAYELIKIMLKFKETGYTKDNPFSEYVKLLFDSMKNGKLYTISTEAGAELNSENPTMNVAYTGYSENLLKWTVPWVFSELWKNNRVPIQSCIRMVSENPAKRLGLFPQKGSIGKGSHADIVIIDPNIPTDTDLTDLNGGKIQLSCSVKATFLRGNLLTPIKSKNKPQGQFIKRTGTTRRKSSSTCWT